MNRWMDGWMTERVPDYVDVQTRKLYVVKKVGHLEFSLPK